MFCLTIHSKHFIYGYMASGIAREETLLPLHRLLSFLVGGGGGGRNIYVPISTEVSDTPTMRLGS